MKIKYFQFFKKRIKLITCSIIFITLTAAMLNSCIKKEDFDFNKLAGFEYSPNVALPLIHSRLTLRDILNDFDTNHLFQETGTHFLYLVYNQTVYSQRADQIIFLPDQNINTNFNFSPGTIIDSSSFSNNINYTFSSPNNERYDSIKLKSGNFNFAINSNLNHNARIYITIPNATKNGVSFSKSIYYNFSGFFPVIIDDTFSLAGYKIKFAAGNQLAINYKITAYADAYSDNSPYNISLGESMTSMQYSYMFGYLGQLNFNLNQDSVFIDIFKNNIGGTMFFMDPKIIVNANNAMGIPLALTFNQMQAQSFVNAPFTVNLTGMPSPWQVVAPTFAQIGQSIVSSFQLDKSNSNVKNAINMSPKFVSFKINALANPTGNTAIPNFVLDTSRFSVDLQVNLPLYGSAMNFKLQDTIKFSLGTDVNKLEWVLFKINTDNGFPVDAIQQIYFADSSGYKIDSLLPPLQQTIASGVVGSPPDYKVISSTHKHIETKIYNDRLSKLGNVKKLLIFSHLATTNSGLDTVKFYSDYGIDVKIGIQAQAHTIIYPNKPAKTHK